MYERYPSAEDVEKGDKMYMVPPKVVDHWEPPAWNAKSKPSAQFNLKNLLAYHRRCDMDLASPVDGVTPLAEALLPKKVGIGSASPNLDNLVPFGQPPIPASQLRLSSCMSPETLARSHAEACNAPASSMLVRRSSTPSRDPLAGSQVNTGSSSIEAQLAHQPP